MTNNRKFLFLAIKPEFAKKIINKEKTIELRKQIPHIQIGDYVIIYASSPMKCVLGYGRVKAIIISSPNIMWDNNQDKIGIDKSRFDAYYLNHKKSIGIEIEHVRSIKRLTLDAIRIIDPSFRPPQGFRYISNHQINQVVENLIRTNYGTTDKC